MAVRILSLLGFLWLVHECTGNEIVFDFAKEGQSNLLLGWTTPHASGTQAANFTCSQIEEGVRIDFQPCEDGMKPGTGGFGCRLSGEGDFQVELTAEMLADGSDSISLDMYFRFNDAARSQLNCNLTRSGSPSAPTLQLNSTLAGVAIAPLQLSGSSFSFRFERNNGKGIVALRSDGNSKTSEPFVLPKETMKAGDVWCRSVPTQGATSCIMKSFRWNAESFPASIPVQTAWLTWPKIAILCILVSTCLVLVMVRTRFRGQS